MIFSRWRWRQKVAQLIGRIMPQLTVCLYKGTLSLLLATCRWRIQGLTAWQGVAQQGPCVLAVWHDRLALLAPLLRRYAPHHHYVAVVSHSREGQLLARLVASYRQATTLYVPHDQRMKALRAIITTLRHGDDILVITPDGPRGPRHCLKAGIAFAAAQTGASVVPVTWRASRCWELPTWDRFAIPKPFATIEVEFGAPLKLDPSDPLDMGVATLQAAMEA